MKNINKKIPINISLVANIISVFVSIFVSFVITKYIIVNLGKESYSFYPTAVNFSNYFTSIFLLVSSFSSRYVIKPYIQGNKEEANSYFSTIFLSDLLLSILICVVEYFFYINIDHILDIPVVLVNEVKNLFLLVFISSVIKGMFGVFSIVYYVKNRMDIKAYETIITNVFKCIILFLALLMNKLTIVFYGVTLLTITILEISFDCLSYLIYMRDVEINIEYFSFDKLKTIFNNGVWQLISQSGALLITNVHLIVSNMFLGISSSSVLSLAQPFFALCSTLIVAFSQFIDPMITKNIIDYKEDSESNIINLYFLYEICTIIPLIVIMTFSNHFFTIWMPSESSSMLYILTLLTCLDTFIGAISIVYISILSTFFKIKEMAIMKLLTGILNIFLTFVFLKYTNLDNVGIVLSSIIVDIIYNIIYIPLYSKKILYINKRKVEINTIYNVSLYSLIILIDLLISILLNINDIIFFILICGIVLFIDYCILFLAKKKKISYFIKFIRGTI